MKTRALALLALGSITGVVALTPSMTHAQDRSSSDNATNDYSWVVRFGGHAVVPGSHAGDLAGLQSHVGSDVEPTASAEFMVTPNFGFDVLLAAPFKHTISLGGTRAASVRELPPTIGMNYHFAPNAAISPFVGIGVNFTWLYSARGQGPLEGNSISLSNSMGPAFHAGFDIKLSDRWLATFDARWIRINSDVRVNGVYVGSAKINPLVYGMSLGYHF